MKYNVLLLFIFGCLFAYLSIPVIGYGSAIAIPTEVLSALYDLSPNFALSMVDIVTLGLPLLALLLVFLLISKSLYLKDKAYSYFILLTPFLGLHLYFAVNTFSANIDNTTLLTSLPKYVLLVLFVALFSTHKKPSFS
ncbi:MAG: hypothetical protein MK175_19570 [Pseudoalteromonas sp.]|uniref:hypothetical protein n=1 Tax=Pseudoalteromonas sp. TaxID=53249 RepID=UPI0025F52D24|nr:hypothetical protein [Pseudoalteromonas sp.]MCH2089386.1 hypothetical protein [Pseudoalteromonas sp.]